MVYYQRQAFLIIERGIIRFLLSNQAMYQVLDKVKRPAKWHLKSMYLRIILAIMPVLLNIFARLSKKTKDEMNYLFDDCTFEIKVLNTNLCIICSIVAHRSFKKISPKQIATDVEGGSGLATRQFDVKTIDYVITFRSVDYAFHVFSGGCTLPQALAQRAFATRGPNDAGVSLTYIFSEILGFAFGWRKAYRSIVKLKS